MTGKAEWSGKHVCGKGKEGSENWGVYAFATGELLANAYERDGRGRLSMQTELGDPYDDVAEIMQVKTFADRETACRQVDLWYGFYLEDIAGEEVD